jgi:hypothetical protein
MLLGAASMPLLVAGCTSGAGDTVDTDGSVPDPDRSALENALDIEQTLYFVVGNVTSGGRDIVRALFAVSAHLRALDTALGQPASVVAALEGIRTPLPTASPSPSPSQSSGRPPTVEQAVRAADRAVNAHVRALRSASATVTPLLASIAASDAAIAAFLRRYAGGEA